MCDNDKKYAMYFPNMIDSRKDLFKNFYEIRFLNDLPVTKKNRFTIGFHPLIASYVLRHILWEILNCPGGNQFKKIENYTINNEMYNKTLNIFNSIYLEGIKNNIIFSYDKNFRTGSSESSYSGLTNAKMLYIYSYYNLINKSEKYNKFCDNILNSLLLDMDKGGCCIKYSNNQLWIDEEANYPNFILNGFLSIIRNFIDLVECVNNTKVENILLQNKNILENLLPLFDCEKYKTSKYRLTTYGIIKLTIKSNNNVKLDPNDVKIKLIYNDKYTYLINNTNSSALHDGRLTFQNNFKIINDVIYIHFIASELFQNKIELSFTKNNCNITKFEISQYRTGGADNMGTSKCLVNFKSIDFKYIKINNKFIININNLVEYFEPSITYFTKEYNKKLYNVYHYNHIDNLKYVNKYFKSNIINNYINKWIKYTTEWKDYKLFSNIKNVSLLPIN